MSKIGSQFKTFTLLALLTALLLFAGEALGGMQGLYIALVLVVVMNFGTFWFSDKIVLKMYKAQPVKKADAKELYEIVNEVSKKAGIPMPKVYTIPSPSPNAFATGRNPEHSAVACTEGIMQLLTKDELRGVIAHEISHIKNRDTLIQVVAATIAGVISYLALFARFAAIFGGRDRNSRGFEFLALAILTPIIAAIIQLAISRSREYLADESAARTIKDSNSLASALAKLQQGIHNTPLRFGSPSTSNIFIANPFRGRGMLSLFSTHPPMDERIKKLKEIKF